RKIRSSRWGHGRAQSAGDPSDPGFYSPGIRSGTRICDTRGGACTRIRPLFAGRGGGNRVSHLKTLESRGSGDTSTRPKSQKSGRSTGPSPRSGAGSEELAGRRFRGKNPVDGGG